MTTLTFAVIHNGVVTNVVMADSAATLASLPLVADAHVDISAEPTVGIGWTYDGTKFTAPPAPPAPPAPTSIYITAYAYANRFTQAERIAIRTAAQTSTLVQDYLEMLTLIAPQGVNILDTQLITDVNALETAGLIAAGRPAQILSTTLAPGEAFK